MGFVFQEFELIEYLTVRENILLPLQLARANAPADRHAENINEQLEQLLQATTLTDRARHYPHQLSHGQRQRAALCRR